jgi:hypothetical protein
MNAAAIITFWQLAGVIFALTAVLALASFAVWCVVGGALWLTGRGRDQSTPPETEPDWFDALPSSAPEGR